MMVFVTHPKYFDETILDGIDGVDLIFIFNGKRLYNRLKSRYRVVLLGFDYQILAENFFSQKMIKNRVGQRLLFNNKVFIYRFLHKIKRTKKRDDAFYRQMGYKQEIRFYLGMSKKLFKENPNKGLEYIDMYIKELLLEIFYFDHGKEFVKKYKDNIISLINLTRSFFRAYVQSLGYERGLEILTELNQYSYLVTVMDRYRFNRYDIYESGFKYGYLKVLCRLFIEHIYKEDLKKSIESRYIEYKENGWL